MPSISNFKNKKGSFNNYNDIFFDKRTFKSLNKLHNSPEYQQNEMQINCIRKVLVENADVPEKLIDWLITSVKENVIMECKTTFTK